MRVCITGGSGFIGSNLMMYLRRTEPDTEVVIADIATPRVCLLKRERYVYADIRNLHSLLRAFEGCDEVYHLAGILGTSELIAVSSLACETNVVGANNVMDACQLAGVKRIYNVAKPHFDGYDENAYTLTKHAGELIGRLYQKKYGMQVATVRWLNAVGPYQHLYPVSKFLPTMVLACMFGIPLEVYGDGSQTIDPIDVEDLSRFTVHALRHLGADHEVVDLGSGSAITCMGSARLVLKEFKRHRMTKSGIIHAPMREGEKPGVMLVADMSYWQTQGMKTEAPFEESIRKTIEYMSALPDVELINAKHFYWG